MFYGYSGYNSGSYLLQWVLIIAALIVSVIATTGVKGAYSKYSKVKASSGKTGAEVAKAIMETHGIYDVPIEHANGGSLSDHFDPKARVIRLSDGIYDGTSVAAMGVAAHEVGHVIQYQEGYAPIRMRNSILPVAQIGSFLSFPLVILGIFMGNLGSISDLFIYGGIALFFAVLVFQLITLPVEFNASSRAMLALEEGNFLSRTEEDGAKKMLRAAAMTYVAGVAASLLTLLRLLLLANSRQR